MLFIVFFTRVLVQVLVVCYYKSIVEITVYRPKLFLKFIEGLHFSRKLKTLKSFVLFNLF